MLQAADFLMTKRDDFELQESILKDAQLLLW